MWFTLYLIYVYIVYRYIFQNYSNYLYCILLCFLCVSSCVFVVAWFMCMKVFWLGSIYLVWLIGLHTDMTLTNISTPTLILKVYIVICTTQFVMTSYYVALIQFWLIFISLLLLFCFILLKVWILNSLKCSILFSLTIM